MNSGKYDQDEIFVNSICKNNMNLYFYNPAWFSKVQLGCVLSAMNLLQLEKNIILDSITRNCVLFFYSEAEA